MTRNSDLYLEDILGCDHKPELPVVEDGEILFWLCRCGRRHRPGGDSSKQEEDQKPKPSERQ